MNAVGPVCKGSDGEEGDQSNLQGGEDFRLVRQLVKRVVAEREEGDECSDDL